MNIYYNDIRFQERVRAKIEKASLFKFYLATGTPSIRIKTMIYIYIFFFNMKYIVFA